jgi:CheY-like chemotaxis protein
VNLLILVVDDEPDVELLFRQQFRREFGARALVARGIEGSTRLGPVCPERSAPVAIAQTIALVAIGEGFALL